MKATFDSTLDAIDALRAFVGASLVRLASEADEREPAALETAAVEAFTNIVQHAHKGREGQTVSVAVTRELDTHVRRLPYAGERFQPKIEPLTEPSGALKESGWGSRLIDALAESVKYDQDDWGIVSLSISRPIGFKV